MPAPERAADLSVYREGSRNGGPPGELVVPGNPSIEDLLGLIERCRVDGDSNCDLIGRDVHGQVCNAVIVALRRDWTRYKAREELLSATIYRSSWVLTVGNVRQVDEIADMARVAPGLHLHPFALLALRSSGLVHSKFDEYTRAWLAFAELRSRQAHHERSLGNGQDAALASARAKHREVEQQSLLAEAGTAARTVERMLEEFGMADGGLVAEGAARQRILAYHEAYRLLRRGVTAGTVAVERLGDIDAGGGRSLDSLATESWALRPHVMTARCYLELIPFARIIERIGSSVPHPVVGEPKDPFGWKDLIDECTDGFIKHYGALVELAAGGALTADHIRELLQLRLHAAVLLPREELAAVETVPGIEVPEPLTKPKPDRDALAEALMSRNWDANILMSITDPTYLAWMEVMGGEGTINWLLEWKFEPLRRQSAREVVDRKQLEVVRCLAMERVGSLVPG